MRLNLSLLDEYEDEDDEKNKSEDSEQEQEGSLGREIYKIAKNFVPDFRLKKLCLRFQVEEICSRFQVEKKTLSEISS